LMRTCDSTGCDKGEVTRKKVRTADEIRAISNRINRIEGQVRGIGNMIKENRYCDDVLTQIAAAKESLAGLGRIILEEHLRTCVAERLSDGDYSVIDELVSTLERYRG